jgi:photosystem II stability/assembly factor-like uncharacterized protein
MRFRAFALLLLAASFTSAQSDNPKKQSGQQPPSKADSDKSMVAQPSQPSTQTQKKAEPKKNEKSAAEKKGSAPAAAASATDEDKPAEPMSSGTFAGLKLRSIGPAFVTGRIVALAVNPKNRAQYYIGAASGGVWRTDNDGATWTPVFEHEGSYSIGAVTMDPNDSSVIWVGTGENNSQRSVAYGDGVYRSDDGGKSWKNMGLKKSEHISRIVVHPKDSNTVFVAAQGPLWGPGGDRGLFKTTDGGKTWKNVLSITENTGVTELQMDPRDPNLMYAASYQRRRHVFTMIDGGPETAIYKSTDGGETWNKLKSGLPSDDMGRIGIAISPSEPDTIYAEIEASGGKGGFFRSRDRGASWEKRGSTAAANLYYDRIYVDPKNPERVYMMNVFAQVSDDAGKTFHRLGEKSKHVDNHVMWIDPEDTDFYLVGCDGGLYETFDRAANWIHKGNLPIVQFYDVAVDNRPMFYNVCGGTQDNYSMCGPSRNKSVSGIVTSDWFITQGGDGFRSQVDPEDPNVIYAEAQYGNIVRYDRAKGETIGIQPAEGKGELQPRFNWDSPFIISPHSHSRIYMAANQLYRSDDRGDSWKAISPDLTRQLDRDKLPVMGKIWGPDAVAKHQSTSLYGNIVALAESPKKDGMLFVGTDDGLIQITDNAGGSWRKVERVPGVPDRTYVSRIAASHFDDRVIYAAFDNHKNSDFKPYLMKSSDGGNTWTSIASNLPENGPVLAFAEDTVNPKLLFAGTEFGLWFSGDGGGKWIQLKGGMPTIAVRDIVVHPTANDLVIATFGRGFYVLDDITPLRNLRPEMLQQEAAVVQPRDALLFLETYPIGGRNKGFMGESYFTAENPPYGAALTYYLKEKYKTPKEQRQEAEKQAAKRTKGDPYSQLPYPTQEQLRAEADAEAPSIWVTVADAAGNVVRRIPATNSAGMNRVTWNLRYPPIELGPEGEQEDNPFDQGPNGTLVMPGKYTARMSKRVNGQWSELGQPVAFNVVVEGAEKMNAADRQELFSFQQKVAKLDRAVSGAMGLGNELKTRVRAIKRALAQTPADTTALVSRADDADKKLNVLLIALRGDSFLRQRQENTPSSINDRVNTISSNERLSTQRPRPADVEQYNIAAEQFSGVLPQLKTVREDVTKLEGELERIGAPWTPGRVPEWSDK